MALSGLQFAAEVVAFGVRWDVRLTGWWVRRESFHNLVETALFIGLGKYVEDGLRDLKKMTVLVEEGSGDQI